MNSRYKIGFRIFLTFDGVSRGPRAEFIKTIKFRIQSVKLCSIFITDIIQDTRHCSGSVLDSLLLHDVSDTGEVTFLLADSGPLQVQVG